ncbi:SixA phosphatase family protein [Chryseosolibacter indicus]|uniref:Histidine phosphatase family protein n=1 Tax=Chryseosolibacter indicus TaxID=2782351 RepID=A0ABS5VV93_9BACT|nr:histidine phosphatase family protein [Chryseosolibacter indicus]MBT1705358.1 histidine phosphatase family protein [Chryseosolibacter indicus]
MPKHLFLLRHAESIEKQIRQQDKDRELSTNGVKEAMQIGSYLLKESIYPDFIFTSNATRTTATTQLVADIIKFDINKISAEDELYDASVRTFLEFITRIDDSYSSVLCVGHNPVISYLAEYLTKAEIGSMATGSLASIKFNFNSWREASEGTGELLNYVAPSMLLID